MTFPARQCRDEVGPRLPPNFVLGEDKTHLGVDALREKYRNVLLGSDSRRRGCHHYVKGFLHQLLGSDVLITDRRFTNDVDIVLSVQVPEEWNVVVLVRYLPALRGAGVLLDDVLAGSRSAGEPATKEPVCKDRQG
jgi:hypothetical protein